MSGVSTTSFQQKAALLKASRGFLQELTFDSTSLLQEILSSWRITTHDARLRQAWERKTPLLRE